MVPAYSSYSKPAVYGVTTDNMTLRFEYYTGKLPTDNKEGRKLPTGMKEGKFSKGVYTIEKNLVTLQHVWGYYRHIAF